MTVPVSFRSCERVVNELGKGNSRFYPEDFDSNLPRAAMADIRAVFVGYGFSLLSAKKDYRIAYGLENRDWERLTYSLSS